MKNFITALLLICLAFGAYAQGTDKVVTIKNPVDGSYGGKDADSAILATDYNIYFFVPANSGNDFRVEYLLDVDSAGGTPNYTATHQHSLDKIKWDDISSVAPVTSADTAFYLPVDTITRPYNRINVSADAGAQKIKIKSTYSFRVLNNIKK